MLHSWGFLWEGFLWTLCKAVSLLFVKRKIRNRIKYVHLRLKQQLTGKENSHFFFAACFCSSTPFLHTQQSHALFPILSVNNFPALIISTFRNFCRDFLKSHLSEFWCMVPYPLNDEQEWRHFLDSFQISVFTRISPYLLHILINILKCHKDIVSIRKSCWSKEFKWVFIFGWYFRNRIKQIFLENRKLKYMG